MRNINLPNWIPSPTAWMSSILLILLMRGLAVLIRIILQMGGQLMEISPKLQIVLYFAALLSPILVVAVAHHVLQIILDRYYPNTRSQQSSIQPGQFPSLMSWWEGFYGWMAIALAIVVSTMLEVIFAPSLNSLYDMLGWWNELRDLFTLPTLYRVITVAYLYQFEHLVRTHLMSVGATSESNQ
jgi:hypothetical protein